MKDQIKYLIKSEKIEAGIPTDIELTPEQSFALKPTELQILCHDSNGNETWVEILNMVVLGNPQLLNFEAHHVTEHRGNSWYFRKSKPVDFNTIGSAAGQGLLISVLKRGEEEANCFIKLKGWVQDSGLIGK